MICFNWLWCFCKRRCMLFWDMSLTHFLTTLLIHRMFSDSRSAVRQTVLHCKATECIRNSMLCCCTAFWVPLKCTYSLAGRSRSHVNRKQSASIDETSVFNGRYFCCVVWAWLCGVHCSRSKPTWSWHEDTTVVEGLVRFHKRHNWFDTGYS